MKTIQKQTLWGTIISFLGVFFGTLNQGFLIPKYLETEQLGLISILFSYSVILQVMGPLGFNYAGSKFFSKFEDSSNGHNGFLFLGLFFILIGIIISSFLLFLFKNWIIGTQIQSSNLFQDYFYFLYPLLIFNTLFNFFDNYAKNLRDTFWGVFLSQFFNRFGTFLATILVIFGFIDFQIFLKIWLFVQCVPALLIFLHILRLPGFSFKPNSYFFHSDFKNEFISFSIWSLFTGIGTIAIFKIDSILVYRYLGLSQIGIYNFCLLFGSVMSISYNINLKTATSFIIKSIQDEEWDKVERIYKKSSLTQAIFGFGILILSFSCLEILFSLINKPEFNAAVWPILIIGYTKIFDLISGMNTLILLYSKYYKWDIVLNGIFVIFLIFLNALLIPDFGINGASIALLFATIIYNFLRVSLIYKKFNLLPFKSSLIEIFIIGTILIGIGFILPDFKQDLISKIFTLFYKSLVLGGIFTFIVIKRNYSEDINEVFDKFLNYLKFLFIAK
ncbi:MAG: hypothetical protein RIR51_1327 [Bacteroidota bacterium]